MAFRPEWRNFSKTIHSEVFPPLHPHRPDLDKPSICYTWTITTDFKSIYLPLFYSPNGYQSHHSSVLTKACSSPLRLIRIKQILSNSGQACWQLLPCLHCEPHPFLLQPHPLGRFWELYGQGLGLSQNLLTVHLLFVLQATVEDCTFLRSLPARRRRGEHPPPAQLSERSGCILIQGVCVHDTLPRPSRLIFLFLDGAYYWRSTRHTC